MDGITLTDTLLVNSLLWIRSLGANELNPSRRMVEDVEALAVAQGFVFEEHVVADRAEMLTLLGGVAVRAATGLRPILHFDCHGSRVDGLLLKPSGDYLSWAALADALRAINVATANHLCCVFGACFGLRMSFELRLTKPSPYYLTIAPEREVSVGVLEDRTAPFYREVFASGNITKAFADVLTPELKLFHCKEIFARALATYIANNCVGKAAEQRQEKMVSALLRKHGIIAPSSAQLGEARTRIKTALAPSQAVIDHFAPTFLIGRVPGFGYAELRKLADGYVRRNHARVRVAGKR